MYNTVALRIDTATTIVVYKVGLRIATAAYPLSEMSPHQTKFSLLSCHEYIHKTSLTSWSSLFPMGKFIYNGYVLNTHLKINRYTDRDLCILFTHNAHGRRSRKWCQKSGTKNGTGFWIVCHTIWYWSFLIPDCSNE